ncbi:hypothetical protein JHK87_033601 [Glycine soja]|nr:hypothetical protein JHK87_033601 [Glycine soja]
METRVLSGAGTLSSLPHLHKPPREVGADPSLDVGPSLVAPPLPTCERQKACVAGSLHVPMFVEDTDNSPITLLKKWVHRTKWTGDASSSPKLPSKLHKNTTIVACVPKKVHIEGAGETGFKISSIEITDAIKAGLDEPIQPEPEVAEMMVEAVASEVVVDVAAVVDADDERSKAESQ